ncbi:SurA N-terminal domain-containing protein [uncultured Aquitalea sp.]|uniref:SurA N-terminal domain-containing protein n=1 Tax=uncultured Aquitalea sp. TaxID=540272 RepID=UPI0025FC472E|nr:SurA N-terminal domain-containing protein [uncultured Aquitalea sp.]
MFDFVQNNKTALQVILGAVALSFVAFGVGSYSSAIEDPYLVKVGGTKIYKHDLDRALEGQPSDPATRQQALADLISRELLLNAAHDAGASIPDQQLFKAISSMQELQDNGKFSPDRYREFLAERNMSAENFEARIRRDMLLQGQVNNYAGTGFVSHSVVDRVIALLGEGRELRAAVLHPADFAAQVKTDDAALKAYYDANLKRFRTSEKVKLDYVVLSLDGIAQGQQVSDAEIQQYYEKHKAEFGGEERRASHILLTVPKGAKPEEKAKIKAEADALLKEVRANPAKFAEIAKAKSQDPGSAANGGDLGFFGHGAMVKPFDDVVFSMQPGKISEVVETEYGFHIIKLDEIKQADLTAVKAAVAAKLKQQKAAALYRKQADSLAEVAYQQGSSLKGIQDALKLEAKHSDWLERGKPAQDTLLNNPKLQEAAFSDDVLKKKHNSEPIDVGNSTMVVVRVADYQPERQLKLDEVKDVIKAQLVATEGTKLAEKQGQAMLAELKAGKQVAALKWGESSVASRRDAKGMSAAEMRAVFGASVKTLPAYAGSKRDNGDFVVYQIDKIIPAPAATDADKAQLSSMLSQMAARSQLDAYLGTLRQKYPVTMGKQQVSDQ